MRCPLCVSAVSAAYASWPEFSVHQCSECGFRFVDTTRAHDSQDARSANDQPVTTAPLPGLPHIQRRVRDVLHFKQPPGRALDVGCGRGELALALHDRGFESSGIDMQAGVIDYLRAHCPQVSWHCASIVNLAGMAERFDVLTLYHVLEHVADPGATLAMVRGLANPGALIVIEVPNVGGLEAKLKGRRWHYYQADHLHYFRIRDLQRLAAQLGLQVLEVRGYQHFSYPQDVWWKDRVKSAVGWLGFQDVISVFLRAA